MISAVVSSEDDLMRAGHHVPHCAVGEQVLECRIEYPVLVMETANVVMSKPSDKDILLPYTYSTLSPVDATNVGKFHMSCI